MVNRESFQCLTFRFGNEIFAVDVSRISRVLDLQKITNVPQTPNYMKGVFNHMGNVVPVVDLKLKFKLGETVESIDTCIIVMEMTFSEESTVIGMMADAVQEVVELESDQIDYKLKFGTQMDIEFIKGIGRIDDQYIIILDIDRILSEEELLADCRDTNTITIQSPKEKEIAE